MKRLILAAPTGFRVILAGLTLAATLLAATPVGAAEAPPGTPGAPVARAGVYSATVTVIPPTAGGMPTSYTG